jgi:hypothetical protein
MVLTAFALLLLCAEPDPSLSVVATATPGLERVAAQAGASLAVRLEAQYVELGSHLKTQGPQCHAELRCLTEAPGLNETIRLLHLRVRPLSAGRLAVELRFIDRARLAVVDRSAAIVEPAELATWAEQAATRLFTRTSPLARQLPPSAFPARSAASAPAALPPPAPAADTSAPGKGVRGADEEP